MDWINSEYPSWICYSGVKNHGTLSYPCSSIKVFWPCTKDLHDGGSYLPGLG